MNQTFEFTYRNGKFETTKRPSEPVVLTDSAIAAIARLCISLAEIEANEGSQPQAHENRAPTVAGTEEHRVAMKDAGKRASRTRVANQLRRFEIEAKQLLQEVE